MIKFLNIITLLMYFLPIVIKSMTEEFIFGYERKITRESIRQYKIRQITYSVIIFIELFITLCTFILKYHYGILYEHNPIYFTLGWIFLDGFIFFKTRNYFQFSNNITFTFWQRFYNMFSVPVSILILMFMMSEEYRFVLANLRKINEFQINDELQKMLIFFNKYISWFFILGFILPPLIKLDIWYEDYKKKEDDLKKYIHNLFIRKTSKDYSKSKVDTFVSNFVWVLENRMRRVVIVIISLILLKYLSPYDLLKSFDGNLVFIFNLIYLPLIALFIENMLELYFIVDFKYIDELNLFFEHKDQKIWYLRNYKETKKFITFKADEIFIDNDDDSDILSYEEELMNQFPFISKVKISKKGKTFTFKILINKLGGYR